MRTFFTSSILFGIAVLCGSPKIAAAEPLSPERAIETTRFLGQSSGNEPVVFSPSGSRYAFALLTGDVERDGNWLTIMSGDASSISAAKPEVVARLFGKNLGNADSMSKSDLTTVQQVIHWIDDEHVGFVWEDDENRIQLFSVSALTKELQKITDHPTSISPQAFGIGPDGQLVYAASAYNKKLAAEKTEQMVREGFVVQHVDAYALMGGSPNGESVNDRDLAHEWFYKEPVGELVRVSIGGRSKTFSIPRFASVSPSGAFALVQGFPEKLNPAWSRYEFPAGRKVRNILQQASDEPRGSDRNINQFFVVDLKTKDNKPLWNALSTYYSIAVWSADSESLLIGPTSLPPEYSDESSLEGRTFVEFNLDSQTFQRIPMNLEDIWDFRELKWVSPSLAEISTTKGKFLFEKREGRWSPVSDADDLVGTNTSVEIGIRSDLNTPPVLVATDHSTAASKTVFNPNPDLLSRFELGRVEKVEWKNENGSSFEGRLYYPVNYEEGTQYPFVIQAYSVQDSFSLYGYPDGIGLGTGSGVYIAQMLAGRDIGVLQICGQPGDGLGVFTRDVGMACSESARNWLIEKGLVDSSRIGLLGFSATGYIGQYTLAESDFVYAAAIMTDNIEGSFIENTLLPGILDSHHGGPAFGDGLIGWLETAPSFRVERIYSPLMKMYFQGGELYRLMTRWELFSRLRRINHPAELYVMPDVRDHGAHHPQNPHQVAAIQNRALDWWLFWLKDEEDPDPAKVEQYESWRKLREQRDELWDKPRPPKLEWNATPVGEPQAVDH